MDFFCLAMGLVVLVIGLVFIIQYLGDKFDRFTTRVHKNQTQRIYPAILFRKELFQISGKKFKIKKKTKGKNLRLTNYRKELYKNANLYHTINWYSFGMLEMFVRFDSIDKITRKIIKYDSKKQQYFACLESIERINFQIERSTNNKNLFMLLKPSELQSRKIDLKQRSEQLIIAINSSEFHF